MVVISLSFLHFEWVSSLSPSPSLLTSTLGSGGGDKNGPTVPSPHPLLKQLLRNLNNEPNISPITEQIKRQQKVETGWNQKNPGRLNGWQPKNSSHQIKLSRKWLEARKNEWMKCPSDKLRANFFRHLVEESIKKFFSKFSSLSIRSGKKSWCERLTRRLKGYFSFQHIFCNRVSHNTSSLIKFY